MNQYRVSVLSVSGWNVLSLCFRRGSSADLIGDLGHTLKYGPIGYGANSYLPMPSPVSGALETLALRSILSFLIIQVTPNC